MQIANLEFLVIISCGSFELFISCFVFSSLGLASHNDEKIFCFSVAPLLALAPSSSDVSSVLFLFEVVLFLHLVLLLLPHAGAA